MPPIQLHPEIADALAGGHPVVALESTVYSTLGLPAPRNAEALDRSLLAVRGAGAVPAVCAVLDGVVHVGLDEGDHDRLLAADRKVAERDLGVALGQRWPVGVTTVSATLAICSLTGIRSFATGGIGGVHHDAPLTGDVSADLDALARHPVVTVCAGAKAFLDLPRTLEELDTRGVAVLGWRCDELPAFWSPSSGEPLPHRADDAAEVAAIASARWELGQGGVLLTAPIPADAGIPREELAPVIAEVLAEADRVGVRGGAVTPMVLGALAEATDGRTVGANLALVEHDATVAAHVAVALSLRDRPGDPGER
ncbi:MAG: pseudouridine-5'-phosphate glycosidase [Actinomycetota bacterium]